LAGLRVGLLFAQKPLLEGLRKVTGSYSLDRLAIVAAAAAPDDDDDDDDWVKRNVARIRATRARLVEGCRNMGLDG
jgi:histidinol-phosphate/aromatic aminotransferase/cobyric acid decarboxylase-like protein